MGLKLNKTKQDIKHHLESFLIKGSEKADKNYQKRIIHNFVNKVFVFDDKTVIFYNIDEDKEITHKDALNLVNNSGKERFAYQMGSFTKEHFFTSVFLFAC
ncbi:MAG: hypothetical protein ACOCRX_06800 [Candidatus Woesearchaeota archaeon]